MRKTRLVALALALVAALAICSIAWAGVLKGTKGDDTLTGTPDADMLVGLAGNDTLDALAGNDRLLGGRGDDNLLGGDGNDVLVGGKGADKLDGGAGDDKISGLGDGRTADDIVCGDGDDTVLADANDKVAQDCEHVKVRGKKPKTHSKDEQRQRRCEQAKRVLQRLGLLQRFQHGRRGGQGGHGDKHAHLLELYKQKCGGGDQTPPEGQPGDGTGDDTPAGTSRRRPHRR